MSKAVDNINSDATGFDMTQEQIDRLHPLLDELSPKLNAYLNSLKQKPKG